MSSVPCYSYDVSIVSFFKRTVKNRDVWRSSFEQQLKKLQELPDGSDSWTPHKPSAGVINTAEKIATNITVENVPIPIVAATSEGGIQVKITRSEREFSYFVYPDQSVEFLFANGDPSGRRSGELKDFRKINALVRLVTE